MNKSILAKEHTIDYTNCTQLNDTDNNNYFEFPNDGIVSRLEGIETSGNGNIKCIYKINLTTTYNVTIIE